MPNLLTRFFNILTLCILGSVAVHAQISTPGSNGGGTSLGSTFSGDAGNVPGKPKEYEIAGITVSGAKYLDQDLLLAVTGLKVGDKVKLPNDESIGKAIRQIWKQDLFADVRIDITRFVGDKVFLNIVVEEQPRMSKYNFKGIKKGEATELKDKIGINSNRVVTDAVKKKRQCAFENILLTKAMATRK